MVVEDMYDGWSVAFEVDGAYDFISQFKPKLEDVQEIFSTHFTLKDLEKYADEMGEEISTTLIFDYLLENGFSDEEFMTEILEDQKETYFMEYVDLRRCEFFKIYKKTQLEEQ
jgi:intein-encoded DNA endonuclease-like protein